MSTLSKLEPSVGHFTPIKSRLETTMDEASKEEKKRCMEAAHEACRIVCNVVAPKDGDELLRSLGSFDSDIIPQNIEYLMFAYKEAPTSHLKTQILSLYVNSYPVKTLMKLHEKYEKITEWQVRKAKEHAKNIGPGIPLEKITRHRVRVDLNKMEHFLDFINRPYFYQDVAFGTRKLKLESGEILTMPNIVRTVTRSTMVAQYVQFCIEESFEPLSRSTLFRILQVRGASQRKALQGLDNTAADGVSGFDTLENIVVVMEKLGAPSDWVMATKKSLKDSKRYLKTQYRVHCTEESACADHCKSFALSDSRDKNFKTLCHDDHNIICESCDSIRNVIQEIADKSQDKASINCDVQQRGDILYDITKAKNHIEDWKAHLLRSENQDLAKQDVLRVINANSILVFMDWAMKFVQIKYREKQSEWYGKRGINWHISSVVSRNATGKLEVTSYAHLFDACTQDWFAVISIIENLLTTVKAERPVITEAYLRSDEAGCYHNNFLIAALRDVGQRVGISLKSYVFSEPQHGKDICDRILCPMKASIRRFCNEGNDITSASHMRNALKERPVKGTTASVNIVNVETKELEVKKLPGISGYHSFCFEDTGVRVWKAYGIGDGKLIPYEKWQTKPQGPTLLEVKEGQEFFDPSSTRVLKESGSKDDNTYQCPESGCFVSFSKLEDLDLHMDIGQHKRSTTGSVYDQLKFDWVSKFSSLTLDEETVVHRQNIGRRLGDSNLPMGWALHEPRGGGNRYSETVKEYLLAKYDLGEKSGNKCDPQLVADDMRSSKLENGERRFTREEWLSKSQIKSFFSRITASRRKQSMVQKETSDIAPDEDLDQWLEEFEMLDEIDEQNKLKEQVIEEIDLRHPIVYDTYNLCELNSSKELAKFNVKMLKEICSYLEIQVKSRDSKKVILEKLIAELSKCTCQ